MWRSQQVFLNNQRVRLAAAVCCAQRLRHELPFGCVAVVATQPAPEQPNIVNNGKKQSLQLLHLFCAEFVNKNLEVNLF
jgi:hypothetical protein